jgi:hypothetical protein
LHGCGLRVFFFFGLDGGVGGVVMA